MSIWELEPVKVCIFGQVMENGEIGWPILQDNWLESASF